MRLWSGWSVRLKLGWAEQMLLLSGLSSRWYKILETIPDGEIKLNFKSMLRWSKQDKILKISSLEYIVICIQFRWFHIHGIQLITVYRFLYSLDFGYCICGLKLRRMEVPERSYFLHHLRQSGDRVWVKTSMFFEEKIKTQ